MAITLADGQLAASSGTILGAATGERFVNVLLVNTSGSSSETIILTVSRGGGTARRIARGVLEANCSAYIANLALDPSDVLAGYATGATTVDYLVTRADGGEFGIRYLDANGALKSGSASIGSGNTTLAGDLVVAGGDADLGASGTAGTLDIFPTTASKGKTQITATANTGDTTTTITNAAQAGARTYTIPDAGASTNFMMGKQAAVARTATADGLTTGTIADAGLHQFIDVTSADANNIIVLPTPTPGTIVVLHVAATGYELRTSDPATIGINGGTGVAAESAIGADTTVVMVCATATSWKGWQLGSDGTLAKVEVAA